MEFCVKVRRESHLTRLFSAKRVLLSCSIFAQNPSNALIIVIVLTGAHSSGNVV